MNIAPASAKQIAFVTDLLATRTISADLEAVKPADLNSREASLLITRMLALPRKPKATAAPSVPATLEGLPKSKYALDSDALRLALTGVNLDRNDMLFVEIREFKGRTYMRRLVGAPGDFLKFRLNPNDEKVIAAAIRQDPKAAAYLFSKEFTCCAVCAAPLTDQVSRDLGLGPICRNRF